MLIDKKPLVINDTGLFSSVFDDESYNGGITWRRIEKLIDEDKWENYPIGKRTVMKMRDVEYIIEAYFLTDIN